MHEARGRFDETENECFAVVGIYRLENEWEDSAYSITPNTIFVPQKAQIEGGFGGPSDIRERLFLAAPELPTQGRVCFEGQCVIVITHDLEIAARMDEVWMMRDGVHEREE